MYIAKKWDVISEATCRYCGRKFVPAAEHALKDNYGIYCKPTCYLKGGNLKKSNCRRVVAIRDGIYTVYRSAVTAANELGLETKMIRDACRNGKPYRGYEWQYEM